VSANFFLIGSNGRRTELGARQRSEKTSHDYSSISIAAAES